MKKANEDWLGTQCEEIETCLNKNNSKRHISTGEGSDLRETGSTSVIQDRTGKCLTEEQEILIRWTEYCSKLYNYGSCSENAVLDYSQPPEEDLQPVKIA